MKLFVITSILFLGSLNLIAQTYPFNKSFNKTINSLNETEVTDCSFWSIDIPASTWGISFGNSFNYYGIRFNYRDCDVGTINGINFTLWDSPSVTNSTINGISIGGMPHASNLNGLNLGFGILGEEQVNGINLGIFATISNGDIKGINFGGLAMVSNGSMQGLNFGGLALVSNGDIGGVNFGGLAQVADGDLYGINFGGLALVSNGDLAGFNIGGLALVANGELAGTNISLLASVANGNMAGLNLSGLALVSSGELGGVNVGGLAVVGIESIYGLSVTLGQINSEDEIWGLSVSGYKTETFNFTGANFTIAWTEIQELNGFSFAAYNRIYGEQNGLTIGIVNYAKNLSGIQIGLINIAGNNEGIFKILPFVNANL